MGNKASGSNDKKDRRCLPIIFSVPTDGERERFLSLTISEADLKHCNPEDITEIARRITMDLQDIGSVLPRSRSNCSVDISAFSSPRQLDTQQNTVLNRFSFEQGCTPEHIKIRRPTYATCQKKKPRGKRNVSKDISFSEDLKILWEILDHNLHSSARKREASEAVMFPRIRDRSPRAKPEFGGSEMPENNESYQKQCGAFDINRLRADGDISLLECGGNEFPQCQDDGRSFPLVASLFPDTPKVEESFPSESTELQMSWSGSESKEVFSRARIVSVESIVLEDAVSPFPAFEPSPALKHMPQRISVIEELIVEEDGYFHFPRMRQCSECIE